MPPRVRIQPGNGRTSQGILCLHRLPVANMEIEANEFAAECLMPADTIKSPGQNGGENPVSQWSYLLVGRTTAPVLVRWDVESADGTLPSLGGRRPAWPDTCSATTSWRRRSSTDFCPFPCLHSVPASCSFDAYAWKVAARSPCERGRERHHCSTSAMPSPKVAQTKPCSVSGTS